jgi:pimeloyl-ACP methyl ester carboxylesterase
VKEYPVFVPYEGEHLGATITVPDDEPQGVVLLLTGTGAPRSHRFQMWSRVARSLAGHGLASVRMDRLGIGDSTGRLFVSVMGDQSLLIQALTVARFTTQALGTPRLAVVGNCSGSRIALTVAAEMPQCVGAACLLPRILEPSGVNRMVIRARRSPMATWARSAAPLQGLRQALGGRRGRVAPWVRDSLPVALERGRLLFVYSQEDRDAYNGKVRTALVGLVGRLPKEHRDRFRLDLLSEGPLAGFDSLAVQDRVLDLLIDWVPRCFRHQAGDAAVSSSVASPAGS